MKLAEIVTVFSVLFLVTFSMGDGAPQWRPQGRFGKRLDQRFPSSWQPGKFQISACLFAYKYIKFYEANSRRNDKVKIKVYVKTSHNFWNAYYRTNLTGEESV
jgi:hypothetical protein